MAKDMETTMINIAIMSGLFRDNGNYYLGFRVQGSGSF